MSRLLYVENLDRYFLTHRLAVARAVKEAGFEVIVAAGQSDAAAAIQEQGFAFEPIPLEREGINPPRELRLFFYLLRLYRRTRPDMIHHFNLKPVTYGTLAARLLRIPVVNTITGLGQAFAPGQKAGMQFRLIKALYWAALHYRRSRITFQNPDDRQEFMALGLVPPGRSEVVPGSGVDCERFMPLSEPEEPPIVAFAARLIWEKGVEDFIYVARRFRDRAARFVLVGAPDPDNHRSVPAAQIEQWVQEGIVEWWGYQHDMPGVISRVAIMALPSTYREGIPKILIEAASAARPIVTYDVPGCREIVHDGVNGFLIPPGDRERLADAIAVLLDAPDLRRAYGQAGRSRALIEFSHQVVAGKFIELYRDLLRRGQVSG